MSSSSPKDWFSLVGGPISWCFDLLKIRHDSDSASSEAAGHSLSSSREKSRETVGEEKKEARCSCHNSYISDSVPQLFSESYQVISRVYTIQSN